MLFGLENKPVSSPMQTHILQKLSAANVIIIHCYKANWEQCSQ